jgi:hypothetical protein
MNSLKNPVILEDSIAAILFKFTANAASFDCIDTPNRPYPLARDRPWNLLSSAFLPSIEALFLYFSLNPSFF